MLRHCLKQLGHVSRAGGSQMVRPYCTKEPMTQEFVEYSVNRITLLGRVGREPIGDENTDMFLRFPVLTDRVGSDGVKRTDSHEVWVSFKGKLYNSAKRIGKGDRIYLEGSVSKRVTMEDGVRKRDTTIMPSFIFKVFKPATTVELEASGKGEQEDTSQKQGLY